MSSIVLMYGNALDDLVRRDRAIATDSPAATRKIVGLAQALEGAGVDVKLISMGRGRSPGIRYHRAMAGQIDGTPIHYLGFLRMPFLSPVFSMIALALIALRLARRHPDAVHLFYNRLSLYLLALLALRITGARCAIDIEDGLVEHSRGQPTARFSNAPTALFDRLTNNGALLANTALERSTSVRPVMAYYGVSQGAERAKNDWQAQPFEILMSGSLYPDTGCMLLAEAVELLAHTAGPRLLFHVTGSGPGLAQLEQVAGSSGRVSLEVHKRLALADYRALLGRCHAGLSLKLIGSPLAHSTFPSKTIEFAEYGLLVIATDISDVRAVFEGTAIYLTRDEPGDLARLIDEAACNRRRAKELATAASSRIAEMLAPKAQGRRLAEFLFNEAAA